MPRPDRDRNRLTEVGDTVTRAVIEMSSNHHTKRVRERNSCVSNSLVSSFMRTGLRPRVVNRGRSSPCGGRGPLRIRRVAARPPEHFSGHDKSAPRRG